MVWEDKIGQSIWRVDYNDKLIADVVKSNRRYSSVNFKQFQPSLRGSDLLYSSYRAWTPVHEFVCHGFESTNGCENNNSSVMVAVSMAWNTIKYFLWFWTNYFFSIFDDKFHIDLLRSRFWEELKELIFQVLKAKNSQLYFLLLNKHAEQYLFFHTIVTEPVTSSLWSRFLGGWKKWLR